MVSSSRRFTARLPLLGAAAQVVVTMLLREAKQDLQVGGYSISKGSKVGLNLKQVSGRPCSGGGGPWTRAAQQCLSQLTVTTTDSTSVNQP